MRIAIPLTAGTLSSHFGHCEQFAIIDVAPDTKTILASEKVDAPEHVPGLLPRWLGDRQVDVVIANGMGPRAQDLLAAERISVIVGASAGSPPEAAAEAFLQGTLVAGWNTCDHEVLGPTPAIATGPSDTSEH
jgi:predicted Fe-Mo cluster-binding NifX family protein